MNLARLNHVGLATPSIEQSVAMYRGRMGAEVVREPFDLPAQGVQQCFDEGHYWLGARSQHMIMTL